MLREVICPGYHQRLLATQQRDHMPHQLRLVLFQVAQHGLLIGTLVRVTFPAVALPPPITPLLEPLGQALDYLAGFARAASAKQSLVRLAA